MATSMKAKAQELIQCFCGCSALSLEEVKKISRLSAQQLLTNESHRTLFRNFLKTQNPTGQSDDDSATQMLNIYERCLDLQSQDEVTEDDVEELAELGLPWVLERNFRRALVEDCASESLEEIKAEYRKQIECSEQFKLFREAIAKKLSKFSKSK